MEKRHYFHTNAKALLVLASVCAFLAIFATIDTSEHYRAWRAARRWTPTQQAVAPAEDAEEMYAIILAALAVDTSVIALSFACGLVLGISLATESATVYKGAEILGWVSVGMGVLFAIIMIAYQVKVGPRIILKGPIFDYDLGMQVPIAAAAGGFPLSALLYFIYCLRNRRSQ
jgi:hypothetical protein